VSLRAAAAGGGGAGVSDADFEGDCKGEAFSAGVADSESITTRRFDGFDTD
jgi:hypothetical protein